MTMNKLITVDFQYLPMWQTSEATGSLSEKTPFFLCYVVLGIIQTVLLVLHYLQGY